MFCANCGTRLEDDALFCTECGASITRRTPGALGQVTGSGTAGEHTMSQTDSLPRPVPAKSRRHHRLLIPIFALAFIVAIAIIVVRVLDGGQIEQVASSSSLCSAFGTTASSGSYDYFFSRRQGGVCRATTDGIVDLIYPMDTNQSYVRCLTMDGDRLFFVKLDKTGSGQPLGIHRMRSDGNEDTIIGMGWIPDYSTGSRVSIDQVILYDHRLFVVLSSRDQHTGSGFLEVVSMDEDGGDRRTLCHQDGIDGTQALVTPDHIYYIDRAGDSSGSTRIVSIDMGSSEQKLIYGVRSTGINWLALVGNRVCFMDDRQVMSVATDGTDAKVLYNVPSNLNSRIVATGERILYLETSEVPRDGMTVEADTWDLQSLSIDGGVPVTLRAGIDFYHASVHNQGGHLLIMENGQDVGSAGERVASVGTDGSRYTEYSLRGTTFGN